MDIDATVLIWKCPISTVADCSIQYWRLSLVFIVRFPNSIYKFHSTSVLGDIFVSFFFVQTRICLKFILIQFTLTYFAIQSKSNDGWMNEKTVHLDCWCFIRTNIICPRVVPDLTSSVATPTQPVDYLTLFGPSLCIL